MDRSLITRADCQHCKELIFAFSYPVNSFQGQVPIFLPPSELDAVVRLGALVAYNQLQVKAGPLAVQFVRLKTVITGGKCRRTRVSMNIPARIGDKFVLFASYPTLREKLAGASRFGFLPHLTRERKLFAKKMAWSLDKCGNDVESKLKMVHPATELYAEEAVEALKAGKVIAVPTDTLYGFACDACSSEAVNLIYEIKGRKHTSPLAICVGDVSAIKHFAVTDHLPHGLLDSLLPGPVTVVLSRGESSALEKSLNPGLDSIGVRVPDSEFIQVIARGLGRAIALTSANLSGKPSSVSVKDFESLWKHCAYVYDGGVLPSGRAGSTVVDLTKMGKYKIIRPGSARDETVAILHKYSLVEESTAT